MSEGQRTDVREIRRIIRVLERLCDLAKQATRHGSLRDGETYAIQQYNAILAALPAQGIEPPSYFPPLPEDAGMGALGFASAQLAEYLSEIAETEANGPAESAGAGQGASFFNQLFSGGEFQHIGEAMREAMPEWMREARRWREASRAGRAAGTAPPGTARPEESRRATEAESRVAELSARMAEIAASMGQPGVAPEELQRLAGELARLAEEQARIARERKAKSESDIDVDVDVDV
jgi:hypothetical protein